MSVPWGRASSEQAWTGLQWWPQDATSRSWVHQVWCCGGGGIGVQVLCPDHVTYLMMHMMLLTPTVFFPHSFFVSLLWRHRARYAVIEGWFRYGTWLGIHKLADIQLIERYFLNVVWVGPTTITRNRLIIYVSLKVGYSLSVNERVGQMTHFQFEWIQLYYKTNTSQKMKFQITRKYTTIAQRNFSELTFTLNCWALILIILWLNDLALNWSPPTYTSLTLVWYGMFSSSPSRCSVTCNRLKETMHRPYKVLTYMVIVT